MTNKQKNFKNIKNKINKSRIKNAKEIKIRKAFNSINPLVILNQHRNKTSLYDQNILKSINVFKRKIKYNTNNDNNMQKEKGIQKFDSSFHTLQYLENVSRRFDKVKNT